MILEKFVKDIYPADISPITRFIWYNTTDKLKYQGRISATSSCINKLEIISVKEGLRSCATTHLYPSMIDEQMREFTRAGLYVYPLRWAKKWNSGFAHYHQDVEENEKFTNGLLYCVVSRNKDDAVAFQEYSNSGNHIKIGELLGFPGCCTDFFQKWFPVAYDPIVPIICNSSYKVVSDSDKSVVMSINNQNVLSNPVARYMGLRCSFHIPCSFNCEKTVELNKVYLDLLNKAFGITSDYFLSLLHTFFDKFSWDAYHGIAIIRFDKVGLEVVTSTTPTKHHWLLL